MSVISKLYDDFMEFNRNWDSYSIEEIEAINNQFQKEFNETPTPALQ